MKPPATGIAAQAGTATRKGGGCRARVWGGNASAQERGGITFVDSPWLSVLSIAPVCEHKTVPMKDRLPALPWAQAPAIFRSEGSSSPLSMSSSTLDPTYARIASEEELLKWLHRR